MADSLLEQPEFMALDLRIIPGKHQVIRGDKILGDLTISQYRLLQILASRPGYIFTRDTILDSLTNGEFNSTERAIDAQVCTLRKRLKQFSEGQDYIETVRGIGYRFREKNPSEYKL